MKLDDALKEDEVINTCTFRSYSEMNKLYRECEQRTARLSKNIMADFLSLHSK